MSSSSSFSIVGQPRIIVAIHGKKGAGKDTLADFLAQEPLFVKGSQTVSFAWALRETIEILSNGLIKAKETLTDEHKAKLIPEGSFGKTIGEFKDRIRAAFKFATNLQVEKTICILLMHVRDFEIEGEHAVINDKNFFIIKSKKTKQAYHLWSCPNDDYTFNTPVMTIGQLLQIFGTEVGRNIFGESIWIDKSWHDWSGLELPIVNKDTRFPNEFNSLVKHRAFLIKVVRPEQNNNKDQRNPLHSSETALDHIPDNQWNFVVNNSGTLADFQTIVRNSIYPAIISHFFS